MKRLRRSDLHANITQFRRRNSRQLRLETLEARCVLSASGMGGVAPLESAIVVFDDAFHGPRQDAKQLLEHYGGQLGHIYSYALRGFSCELPTAAIDSLKQNSTFRSVEPNLEVVLDAQVLPTGVDRIDGELNPLAKYNGIDGPTERINLNVATIDTGVDLADPDLNIAGAFSFVSGQTSPDDGNGHGTHVAGTMAALDNSQGVVGVAPGANIWSFRAFDDKGSGTIGDVLAAMDSVIATRMDTNTSNDVAVLNMSFAFGGGYTAMDSALAAMASQGIVLVAAAGNYGWNSANKPANHADVMAVAALADSDGRPGGLGPSTSAGPDDTYASFSNRGQIAAPGVDILSTWKGTGLKVLSGTSMASPHVAGAAAMLISQYPNAFANGSHIPQDRLDTRLVRDVLLATGLDNGTILSQYGVSVPVLRANGVWKTVPIVEIVSQVNGATLSGVVTINIDARDLDTPASGLTARVVIVNNSNDVVFSASLPAGVFTVNWDASTALTGAYTMTVNVTDGQGFVSSSAPVTVQVNGAVPPSAIVSPVAGLITTETGGQATFTVRLDHPPTSNVTIPVSSSDTTEGTVSTPTLIFTPDNWNVTQTVTITGVDDTLADGNIAYTIILGAATSTAVLFNGLDPSDVSVTNTDNESTKFYVVNDGSTDRTYEYADVGNSIEDYALNSANTAPRGAASNVAGDKVWVVDANRKVFVYNNSGLLLGSWTASNFNSGAQIEGIATNGTDIWILDRKTSTQVFKYTGAASRTSGSQTAASSFSVFPFSGTPLKDIVTDGAHVWVVLDDSTTDKILKYTVAGVYVGEWVITTPGASSPTGITIDPSNVNHFWIVDSGTDRVYQYDGAASRSSGSQSASSSFALAAGNSNPQGIADPPPPTLMQPDKIAASASSMAGPVDFAVVQLFDESVRREPSRTSEYDRTDSTQAPTRSMPTYRLAELPTQPTKQLAASESRGASAAKRLARSTDDIFSTWNADELEMFDM